MVQSNLCHNNIQNMDIILNRPLSHQHMAVKDYYFMKLKTN